MRQHGRWFLGLALAALATTTLAYPEVWIEGEQATCGDGVLTPSALDIRGVNDNTDSGDLDSDGTNGSTENTDGDEVFGTIDTGSTPALSSVSSGGIVHLPGNGVFRETDIQITQSMTIRAGLHGDAIVSNDCAGGGTAFDIDLEPGEIVVLENLTIRGFATAIDATGSSGGMLILRNCTIQDNSTAAILADDGLSVRVEGCRIVNSGTAISGPTDLHVLDSEILRNDTAGITSVNASWLIRNSRIIENESGLTTSNPGVSGAAVIVIGSQIIGNQDHGISLDNQSVLLSVRTSDISRNNGDGIRLRGHSTSGFSINGTNIEGNSGDGLNVDNSSSACTAVTTGFRGVVADSQISLNTDDGIEIDEGSGTCGGGTPAKTIVSVGLMRSSIINNGDRGIVETTSGASFFDCEVGHNSLFGNLGGAELNTGSVCTGLGSAENQLH